MLSILELVDGVLLLSNRASNDATPRMAELHQHPGDGPRGVPLREADKASRLALLAAALIEHPDASSWRPGHVDLVLVAMS
jgi:hypothetical protein